MRKIFLMIITILMFTLTGCGGGNSTSENNSTPPAENTTPAETPAVVENKPLLKINPLQRLSRKPKKTLKAI